MAIRRCPTSGSRRIRRETVTVKTTVRRKTAEVPNLQLAICPDCSEKLFDLEAFRRNERPLGPNPARPCFGT